MMNKNPKKSTFISFVKLLISYQRYGVFIAIFFTLIASILDTFGLALVVPTIELLVGTASEDSIINTAHSASNMILNFTRSVFGFIGFEYTLRWMLIAIFIVMGLRAISIFLYSFLISYFQTGIIASLRGVF